MPPTACSPSSIRQTTMDDTLPARSSRSSRAAIVAPRGLNRPLHDGVLFLLTSAEQLGGLVHGLAGTFGDAGEVAAQKHYGLFHLLGDVPELRPEHRQDCQAAGDVFGLPPSSG